MPDARGRDALNVPEPDGPPAPGELYPPETITL